MQIIAILGSVVQTFNGQTQEVALPLIYALLQRKSEKAYKMVFEVVVSEGRKLGLAMEPQYVMSDFEFAIINASDETFMTKAKACFFHFK